MNETLKKIDVKKPLSKENFRSLFTSQLFLTDEEVDKINNVYFPTYSTFYANGVKPEQAWLATRNLFISQETQIGERIKNGSS
ncbi:MAG: hypothetical protein M0R03_22965 [Novosphingobium sp.]|nr:hypothetical protein [Novosphingobium sp.]